MSTLNNKQILEYRENGEIIIEPFNIKNLKNASYDVRLGEYFFREQKPEIKDETECHIFNMYSKNDVIKVWGEPQMALPYSHYKEKGIILDNIKDDDKIIMIGPGESILGHTIEFIGGVSKVNTMLQTRSSVARSFLETHLSAGWGDIGYFNRITFEIHSNSQCYTIPLVVGRRIAQVVFTEMQPIDAETKYNTDGKYQSGKNLEEVINKWVPEDMLPKKYLDYEINL